MNIVVSCLLLPVRCAPASSWTTSVSTFGDNTLWYSLAAATNVSISTAAPAVAVYSQWCCTCSQQQVRFYFEVVIVWDGGVPVLQWTPWTLLVYSLIFSDIILLLTHLGSGTQRTGPFQILVIIRDEGAPQQALALSCTIVCREYSFLEGLVTVLASCGQTFKLLFFLSFPVMSTTLVPLSYCLSWILMSYKPTLASFRNGTFKQAGQRIDAPAPGSFS